MEINWPDTIGRTPLVRLSRLFENDRGIKVYAKLELMNPSGSAKDRPALRILRQGVAEGRIRPGSVVIESSSGNMAISMAALCSRMGMSFICVVDPRTSANNIHIMEAYGAQVSRVEQPDAATGEFLPARLQRVQELLGQYPGAFWPNQYANAHNCLAHYEGTMPEIVHALGKVDLVIGGVSTCGTMVGCARYIRDNGLSTKVAAVDAAGSVVLGGERGPRLFPGLGAGIVPPFAEQPFADYVLHVSDPDMALGCRRLVAEESILAGPSSGAVVSALLSLMERLPSGAVCAAIIHDRGERYLDTVYNDDWVHRYLGETAVSLSKRKG